MFLSGFIASQLVVRSPQSSLLDEQLFSRYRHLLKSYHLLIAPYLDGLPVLKQRQKIIFSDAVDKGIKHRGGNLNLVVPVGTVAGVAGFVDLEECKRSTDAHYHAFIPKQKLRALFDEAVEELYQTGDRKDF
jgi:hypothetical protein